MLSRIIIDLGDKSLEDGGAVGVGGDLNEEAERFVVVQNGNGFFVELADATVEDLGLGVVWARAPIAEQRRGFEAVEDVLFRELEENGEFDGVMGSLGGGEDGIFFAGPPTDGGKNEGERSDVGAGKIGEDVEIEEVGRGERARGGEILVRDLLDFAENEAGGEKLRAEELGEFDADGILAAHREAEDVDTAGAEPGFDKSELVR